MQSCQFIELVIILRLFIKWSVYSFYTFSYIRVFHRLKRNIFMRNSIIRQWYVYSNNWILSIPVKFRIVVFKVNRWPVYVYIKVRVWNYILVYFVYGFPNCIHWPFMIEFYIIPGRYQREFKLTNVIFCGKCTQIIVLTIIFFGNGIFFPIGPKLYFANF